VHHIETIVWLARYDKLSCWGQTVASGLKFGESPRPMVRVRRVGKVWENTGCSLADRGDE
jgi:hypothetical protein